MDWVSVWKVASIGVTGTLGIVGLVADNRTEDRRKLTKWGRLTLAGLLLSTCFGIAAETLDQVNSAAAHRKTEQDTLTLLKQTKSAVDAIARVQSPLRDVKILINLRFSCEDPKISKFCGRYRALGLGKGEMAARVAETPKLNLSVSQLFYRDPAYRETHPGFEGDMEFHETGDFRDRSGRTTVSYDYRSNQLLVQLRQTPRRFTSPRLVGVQDLRGALMNFILGEDSPKLATAPGMMITTSDGQSIFLDDKKFKARVGFAGRQEFDYIFSDDELGYALPAE